MRIGFYPGCSLNGTSREYNESVKALAQAMGLELIELKDWNCCGATAAQDVYKRQILHLVFSNNTAKIRIVFELYAVKHKNLLFHLNFLFIRVRTRSMLQTCYKMPAILR